MSFCSSYESLCVVPVKTSFAVFSTFEIWHNSYSTFLCPQESRNNYWGHFSFNSTRFKLIFEILTLNRFWNVFLHRAPRFFRFQCSRSQDPTGPLDTSIFCPLLFGFWACLALNLLGSLLCGGFSIQGFKIFGFQDPTVCP